MSTRSSTGLSLLFGSVLLTVLVGCASEHELIVYNASGRDFEGLSVTLREVETDIGRMASRSVVRVRFRQNAESSYFFKEHSNSGQTELGSCGYSSGPWPFSTVSHLVVLRPLGSPECFPIGRLKE